MLTWEWGDLDRGGPVLVAGVVAGAEDAPHRCARQEVPAQVPAIATSSSSAIDWDDDAPLYEVDFTDAASPPNIDAPTLRAFVGDCLLCEKWRQTATSRGGSPGLCWANLV